MTDAASKTTPTVCTGPQEPVAVPGTAVWMSSRQVRDHFGRRSAMWLHRKILNDARFPRPVYFGRLQFFRVAELRAWEQQCVEDSKLKAVATG
jgi:hypothetical protein